ncbi:MAG: hypothetical protein KDB14_20150 [Planctomycetales bacterium]|nr:hypothetical protein [Planctomycetales bacterium]
MNAYIDDENTSCDPTGALHVEAIVSRSAMELVYQIKFLKDNVVFDTQAVDLMGQNPNSGSTMNFEADTLVSCGSDYSLKVEVYYYSLTGNSTPSSAYTQSCPCE